MTVKQRIVVAMSGGVDSSVAAALLARAGHDVVGVTLQLYDHGAAAARKGSCCAGQDIHDARRAAGAIGIPHYVLDYEARFERSVMRPFADSYAAGRTPVPCITCNQEIKFKDLLETARELGADALATGHYIQRRDGPLGPELHRAADALRDQSYFLFSTTREQLAGLMFPIGGMAKTEVRDLARGFGLPVAEKADSQDICFVPTGRYTRVVERLRPEAREPGDIVHVDGRRLGRHAGIMNYTIGQRRGLGVASGEPLFVVALDAGRNAVVVGPRACLHTVELSLSGVNWLGDGPWPWAPGARRDVHVRVRSTRPPAPALLEAGEDGAATVLLRVGEDGVAAGQACVFYEDGDPRARVLGGGWIERTSRGRAESARPEPRAAAAR